MYRVLRAGMHRLTSLRLRRKDPLIGSSSPVHDHKRKATDPDAYV
ncbi:hypothetical protein C8J27_11323 [Rhodobacter aestuarii]|nr:hypothetical protein C8J27_11323 [Rhodobacter aestuarii]